VRDDVRNGYISPEAAAEIYKHPCPENGKSDMKSGQDERLSAAPPPIS